MTPSTRATTTAMTREVWTRAAAARPPTRAAAITSSAQASDGPSGPGRLGSAVAAHAPAFAGGVSWNVTVRGAEETTISEQRKPCSGCVFLVALVHPAGGFTHTW